MVYRGGGLILQICVWFAVYFNQCLGAADFKCWSKFAISMFFVQKAEKGRKSKKMDAKFFKK